MENNSQMVTAFSFTFVGLFGRNRKGKFTCSNYKKFEGEMSHGVLTPEGLASLSAGLDAWLKEIGAKQGRAYASLYPAEETSYYKGPQGADVMGLAVHVTQSTKLCEKAVG